MPLVKDSSIQRKTKERWRGSRREKEEERERKRGREGERKRGREGASSV